MSVNEIERKLKNISDRGRRYTGYIPSLRTLTEGEEVISDVNGIITMYRKQNGKLYKISYSSDGRYILDDKLVDLKHDVVVGNDLTINGAIKGTRAYFDGGEAATFSSGRYLDFNNGIQMTANTGYRMHRAGSIIGVSAQFSVTVNGTDSRASIQVRKNGSSVFSSSSTDFSGTPTYQLGMSSTQSRGKDRFVSGNVLSLYANITSDITNGTVDDFCAFFEIVFDN